MEWKAARRAKGLKVPKGPPPRGKHPDYTQDVGAALPGERRGRKRWDDFEECVEWVTRYLHQLRPGERASQRGYDAWAGQQEGAPWSSTLGESHGGWAAVRDAAWARLRGDGNSGARPRLSCMARDWEATLQSWVRPASDTEERKRDRAVQAVTDALNALPDVRSLPINVYPKGSYANNTNVRADSDVDVVVEYTGIMYYDFDHDLKGMTGADAGFGTVSKDYPPSELKDDVERALVSAFGRSPVSRHNKVLTVREQSNRLAADVVPCFTYRRYHGRSASGALQSYKGTKLFPDNGGAVINWPEQHLRNGTAKNNATGRRYKRMVRALKNLENEMCDKGILKEAPGYFAECLVYNVPNENFGHARYVDDMRSVLAYLWNNTRTDAESHEFVEVNALKWLFRGLQKWTREDAHRLVDAGWNYMDFE